MRLRLGFGVGDDLAHPRPAGPVAALELAELEQEPLALAERRRGAHAGGGGDGGELVEDPAGDAERPARVAGGGERQHAERVARPAPVDGRGEEVEGVAARHAHVVEAVVVAGRRLEAEHVPVALAARRRRPGRQTNRYSGSLPSVGVVSTPAPAQVAWSMPLPNW